jgi:adenosylhomocysteine nucleosidase
MAREVRLVAGVGVSTLASGGSPQGLRAALQAWRGRPSLVLSFGLAGSLDPALRPGDVVVGSGVRSGSASWRVDTEAAGRLAERLQRGGLPVQLAGITGSDLPLGEVAAKAELHRQTEAAAVDMESHIAAAYAAEHSLPFLVLRAVCDPAERSLPPLVASALRPDGSTDLAAILRSLARRPGQLPQMLQLARDANAAFASLRRCRDLLGIGRGRADLVELLRHVA